MEFYNVDGKKLRKKDTEIYYYSYDTDEYIKVPGMFDKPQDIKKFVSKCVTTGLPDVTQKEIDEMWEESMKRNALLLTSLATLKSEHEATNDIHRTKAYGYAISTLKKLNIPIVSGAQAMKLKGIGKGIASHIDEILKNGRLKSQDERMEGAIQRQTVLDKFQSIWGVGPKNANAWYSKGHREIEDLINEKLTEQQKVGIQYYDEFKVKIPRDEASAIHQLITRGVKGLYPKARVEIVGSYRRGLDEIGDIDIMIDPYSNPSGKGAEDQDSSAIVLAAIIDRLSLPADEGGEGVIVESPVLGEEKFMGVGVLPGGEGIHRRIDIRIVPTELWGVSLLHHTGSENFNRNLRTQASQLGYRLSEKGLVKLSVKDDELIPTPTERDVFRVLGVPYVEPQDRR